MTRWIFNSLPKSTLSLVSWPWPKFAPFLDNLLSRSVDSSWLADWSKILDLITELNFRLYVATSVNTNDKLADKHYKTFLRDIYPSFEKANQKLKEKFLASKFSPKGFAVPLRNLRSDVKLFREENLPLEVEIHKLENEFNAIISAQTVKWQGRELTLTQLTPVLQNPDRNLREKAWRLSHTRRLKDRQKLNRLWVKLLKARQKLSQNAGFQNFLEYRWRQLRRFDYTPEDCQNFHQAIETVVVPAVTRVLTRHRRALGLTSLRPWDLKGPQGHSSPADLAGTPPLVPFKKISELEEKAAAIFNHVDPHFGNYFRSLQKAKLLDLENHKGKAPGGYCVNFDYLRKPFIFVNAVGLPTDVRTLIHEAGHAFQVFETSHLPWHHQRSEFAIPIEFAEVASMGMELLANPYLEKRFGGFYEKEDANRARREKLEEMLFFWPYMAVVDSFQHWIYQNPSKALNPSNLDAKWTALWHRFMPGIDWRGLTPELETGWHRKLHIFTVPLYYVEYGVAQLGACQIWRNALKDQKKAVAFYRKALSLGGTATLPSLYREAGIKFSFDQKTLSEIVALIEKTLISLE